MPKANTNALIMMTAQGDTAAFEMLYKQMRKPVYFYALHFCGDHALAEDVMQDTFVTVWVKTPMRQMECEGGVTRSRLKLNYSHQKRLLCA